MYVVALTVTGNLDNLPSALAAVGTVLLAAWLLLGPWIFRRRVARAHGGRHRSEVLPWNRAHRG
ncbi:hypothetical protein KG112_11340 [Nocardioides sp. zg-ZUI104]|uniref:hypothetical protein n=1 Tax=Nocardioides faecalis TaxID=2803858 RepID=UPI001BD07CF8|nr:hypothetical protein [Nocardioides faecalis]MBS4753395.1 hypothetical protein [Nocardioides faecalis]